MRNSWSSFVKMSFVTTAVEEVQPVSGDLSTRSRLRTNVVRVAKVSTERERESSLARPHRTAEQSVNTRTKR